MQTNIFKTKRFKTECIYFLISLGISDLLNDIHIIINKLSWKVMFTNLDYVFMFAIILYGLSIIIRVLIRTVKSFIQN